MQGSDKKMELLAPAGDFVSLEAAINCGADAVYFGGKNFNARANADNFEDLTKAVRLCHLFGVKAYLTLNTALKQNETEQAREYVISAYEAGIDAFIIADLALLPIIKEHAPKAEVHASTQMGVHNRAAAALFEKMGFDRIILSREVTVEDIIDIRKHISIDIEVFVHGAICIGFSGACLFSSMLTGNSGNRGRCLQLCRQKYHAEIDGKRQASGFLLSPKDLCMIERLDELKKAGVNSLKIEGRLKRAEYVAAVVSEYKKALQNSDYDIEVMKKMFNRGDFTAGYDADTHLIYPSAPNHIGVPVGKVIKVQNGYAVLKTNKPILDDDGFKILRECREIGGFSGKGAKADGNGMYKVLDTMDAQAGDTVSITTDSAINGSYMRIKRKLPVEFEVTLIAGQAASIIAKYDKIKVLYTGKIVDTARTAPLSKEKIAIQLDRLGDTVFSMKSIDISTQNAFMPLSALNELKRNVIELLEQKILQEYDSLRKPSRKYNLPTIFENDKKTVTKLSGIFVEVDCPSKLTDYLLNNIKLIVYAPSEFSIDAAKDFLAAAKREDNVIFIKLPIFARFYTLASLKNISILFSGIICNNYYAIQLALECNLPFVLSYNMNLMNKANPILRYSANKVISVELLKEEIPFQKGLIYAYGNLPLMYFAHCPRKTANQVCGECQGPLEIKDKKGYYIVNTIKFAGQCLHEMKNGIKTNVGSRMLGKYDAYLDFTQVSTKDIDALLKEYIDGSHVPSGIYTLNHLIRGVR